MNEEEWGEAVVEAEAKLHDAILAYAAEHLIATIRGSESDLPRWDSLYAVAALVLSDERLWRGEMDDRARRAIQNAC